MINIRDILEELYTLDPALRSEEADLKEIIEKLIANRPEAEPDEDFKARLKKELHEKSEQEKKRAGFFVVHRKSVVRAAGIAAALIVVLVFAIRPGLMMSSENAALTPVEEYHKEAAPAPLAEADVQVGKTDSEVASVSSTEAEPSSEEVPQPVQEILNDSIPPSAPKRMMEKSATAGAAESFDMQMGIAASEAESPNVSVSDGYLSGEEYKRIVENGFLKTLEQPLSTFSIDVDTASYSNVRRFLNSGMLPNPDAVRIEELINYFTYDYRQPADGKPFSITTELSSCPWNSNNLLLHIGLQGFEVNREELPPTNLVFLLDSSGSMTDENKLPLLKQSMSLLIDTLRPEDLVSIVAYAGSAGLVLPPTAGNRKAEILSAVENLSAGGSTAGGAGIDLAYRTAAENYLEGGNNRVILATDGDFNVGQSSEEELKGMIEQRRDQGIYLTVLGLGMGNYKDARMEALADSGNGNYAYIDTLNEANKVLITELSSTLLTIAKDVKIQVDFNASAVESYRLVGYENRVMAAEDFSDDRKDAGEIGAGHSVTALYEIVPANGSANASSLAELRLRYKNPDEDQSQLLVTVVGADMEPAGQASDNFVFSAAVAEWGMLLRGSEYIGERDISRILKRASSAVGNDSYGYRKEFLKLLRMTAELMQ